MGGCSSKEAAKSLITDDLDATVHPTLQENLLWSRKGDVFAKYEIVRRLGKGSMGDISKVKVKANQVGGSAYANGRRSPKSKSNHGGNHHDETEYALKSILLSRITPESTEELKNEIAIMKKLDHPNIVKAFEVFKGESQIFIVMELCSGGDLYKRLPYSEKEAARIMEKVISAIGYMHDMDIVHRDLKFENIMFETSEPDSEIKLIDFGLSKKFLPGYEKVMTEFVGTINTMSPQVLQGRYTSQADLWACGVIAFMLLSSAKPFYHEDKDFMIDKIMRVDYSFEGEIWDTISDQAKDFISKLLVLDRMERMDAKQALAHPWLSNQIDHSDAKPTEDMMRRVAGSLWSYKDSSALKKLALNVIAHQSSTEEIATLRKAFNQYDKARNGVISYDEFKSAMRANSYTEDQLTQMFESIDVDHSGTIMYTEFIAATLEASGNLEEDRIAEAFDRIDSDGSGKIGRRELERILGETYTSEQIDELVKSADVDGDGEISFTEFLEYFRKDNRKTVKRLSVIEPLSVENKDHLLGLDAEIPGGKHEPPPEMFPTRPRVA